MGFSDGWDNGKKLQVYLNGVATFIGKIGLIIAMVVFVILLVRLFT
jgi:Ca2+-transporting ATPase